MGRDYWRWCSSAPTPNSRSSTKSSSSSSSKDSASAGGCISAVFHFLDFRFPHLHSNPHFIPQLEDQPITLQKGLEAPRNSLESEDEIASPASTSKLQDEILNIPKVMNRIKTSRVDTRPTSTSTLNDCSSDNSSSSPAAKTPSLVARLMGLDPLPNCDSPLISSSSSASLKIKPFHGRTTTAHRNSFDGTRSLPETPRISLARRSVDADCYHHRHSLQINNDEKRSPSYYAGQIVNQVKDRVDHRLSLQTNRENMSGENRRPSYYARQIFSQVKDRVGRKTTVAPLTDVTNTRTLNRDQQQLRHYSVRSSDQKTRNITIFKKNTTKPNNTQHVKGEEAEKPPPRQAKKCKTSQHVLDHKFKIPLKSTSDIIRNKQEEPFIRPATVNKNNLQDKNGKKTPLSSQLLPVKRDPSPPDIRIPQKQVIPEAQKSKRRSSFSQLPSTSRQRYKREATHQQAPRNSDNRYDVTNSGVTTTAENEYVNSILRRIGISEDKSVSSTIWFSPAHPLDPSIFFYLEHFSTASSVARTGGMDRRSNRKLLFQLVDEILVEILKPYLKIKPWIKRDLTEMNGTQLTEALISKIRSFPGADCRVLEDIDALVDMDLPVRKLQNTASYEEEGEGIVTEIEKDIVDTLILETTAYFLWGV